MRKIRKEEGKGEREKGKEDGVQICISAFLSSSKKSFIRHHSKQSKGTEEQKNNALAKAKQQNTTTVPVRALDYKQQTHSG